jgi:hypothetical protein
VGGNRILARIVVFLASLLLAAAAFGQATTSLRGAVTDPSGAAIPGAKVTIVNPETGATRSATTAGDGTYVFTEVLPGTYTLSVEATGFQKFQQSDVVLRVALPATVNVGMKVGAVTQVVSVSGQAPLLNTTNASIGQTMGSTQIEQLPLNARNVPALLSIQPGVVYTSDRSDLYAFDTRSGAVNGERSDQSNVTLDGVDVNDQFEGTAFHSVLPVTVDSVQEFRVTTSNYGASEGRSSGGQVALVTKGGTNHFHGSLYEYNRNTSTVANDFFIKSAEAANGQPNVPPKLIRNIFGGSIGGPFIHNRFFFFFNYEGRRDAQADSAVRTIPSSTLRDGIIQYQCATSSDCPGGAVTGLSGKSYTVQPGYYALNDAQLTAMDPVSGGGPNKATLAYFNSFPQPNDNSVGDGFNFSGYRFAAPISRHYNWLIGRLDYKLTASGSQTLFLRGSGRDDTIGGEPFLPAGYVLGGIPQTQQKDLSKGFVVGYTALFGTHWVNNFRYGLTYQSIGTSGNSNLPWNFIRSMNQGVFRSNSFTVPVHNIVDDVSWTHGSHTMQFGLNFYIIRRNSNSTLNSFSDGVTNADWIDTAKIARSGDALDPGANNYPAVSQGFVNSYDFPLAGLLGMVTEVDATYNYHLNPDSTGTALAQGAPVPRHWSIHQYDLYWQDVWQVKPNVTFTYGLRWGLLQPIYENTGQEVAPTFSLGPWFNQRGQRMVQGLPSSMDPSILFAPAGAYYGKPGFYGWQTRNFAPRIAVAWTPHFSSGGWLSKIFGSGDKTVIRAGWGMYHDHFGPALATAFDTNGAFGLSTTLTNPAGTQTIESAPRLTSMNVVPKTDNNGNQIFIPAPPAKYPQLFPNTLDTGGFAIAYGLDSSLRTPYSYAIDFSVDRQLTSSMSLSVSYVGHLAHRLLVQSDLAMPYDIVDPKSGISYFQAAARFSQLGREGLTYNQITPSVVGPTAQFWLNQFKMDPSSGYPYPLCTVDGTTTSKLQAMYDTMEGCTLYNETTGLFYTDLFGFPLQPTTGYNTYFNPQFSSLYAWRSIGYSNYNSLQVSLQKRMSHGILFDFNYTYSKSLDIQSDATSVGNCGIACGFGSVINSWSPYQLYGPSAFDLRHQINADWVVDLPFGRGRMIGRNVGRGLDAVIGGWQLSGLARWTTGFPVNAFGGYAWPTNWELGGNAILTGKPIPTATSNLAASNDPVFPTSGGWNMFSNVKQAFQGFDYPFPGQSGVRNAIRGQGYAGWDMGLSKQWHMPYNEAHTLQFRWDVFNVPNLKRFDVQSVTNELDIGSYNFGKYTRLLTNPRIMQFALRYQF